jgi:4-hydroxy-tetrahydrodipicolinate synthase
MSTPTYYSFQMMLLLTVWCYCLFYSHAYSNQALLTIQTTSSTSGIAWRSINHNKRIESLFTKPSISTRTRKSTSLSSTNENKLMDLSRGSTVALITPFIPNTLEIDYLGLKKLLQYHLDSGTAGLCILGTTSESPVMTMEERKNVIQITTELCKGRIPILVGAGAIDPAKVKTFIYQARDLGADAVMVVTPYYVKPPQRALVQHFTTVANVGMPTVLYNVPGRTASDCLPETIYQCCMASSNIVGVKEATGDVSRVKKIRALLLSDGVAGERKLLLYSGDDATSVDFCLQGGDGSISVTANVAAKAVQETIMAALNGDAQLANKLNAPLELLHDKLFCEANPIPIKWAAERIGLIGSAVMRPPLVTMDEKFHPVLEEALTAAGLL